VTSTSPRFWLKTTRPIVSELELRSLFCAGLLFTAITDRLASNRPLINRITIMAALLAYALIVDPDTGYRGIPCVWKNLFGFECPGCGLSRAGALLLRGRVHEAVHSNWLIFPFVWASACKAVSLYFPSVVNSWRFQRWQN
jgi:Protein of unknown function (DUF2752)